MEEARLSLIQGSEAAKHNNENSPEALFISALVTEGTYTPGAYGIRDEQVRGHRPVHEFCARYQAEAKTAPPLDLLFAKFPTFPYIEGVSPMWAATQLSDAHTNRMLRKAMSQASRSVAEDANQEAIDILKTAITSISPAITSGINVSDMSVMEEMENVETCPVPDGMINNLTGGMAPGDLWYVAARLGIGKSWRLIQHAISAAEAGWDVVYFSLEMPAKSVLDRIHRMALRDWSRPWQDIDLKTRGEMMEKWSSTSGTISVFDPTAGRCDAAVVSAVSAPKTLVVVDYIGLMYTNTGQRSIEDWRSAATISNQLKEVALEQNVPIIAAAQINRAGDKENGMPSAANLAQSDALGQDADALITIKRHSRRVLMNSLTKYRHGESGARWYTQFEPGKGILADISPDKANTLKMEDDEAEQI
jgi:hypothetical protein